MTLPCEGIPLTWVARHCEGAVRQGLAAEQLLGDAQIAPALLADPAGGAQIGPGQYMLFSMNTAWRVGDALRGMGRDALRIGQATQGIRVMLGCATLEGGLRAAERYFSQTTRSAAMRIDAEGDWACVNIVSEGPIESAGIVDDMALAWLFMCASRFLGRALPVAEVRVRDPRHFNLGGPHWAVKAPVRLGTGAALLFPKTLLAARRGGAASDDALWPCINAWLRFVGNDAPGASAIVQATPSHAPARTGRRAERQRLLADRGLQLLRESSDCVDAVASELGYSDARSFRRFMKASTGLTPQQIRQRGGTQAAPADLAQRMQKLAMLMDAG